MRMDLREIIQGACMLGVFGGMLLIDANMILGAIVTLGSVAIFFLMEKGIM